MEPPVSEPSATQAMPLATAAADPPELPPGTRPRSQGFEVFLKWLVSVDDPKANSSMFVLPKGRQSASRAFCTQVAVKGLT